MKRLSLLLAILILAGCASPQPAAKHSISTNPEPTEGQGQSPLILLPADGSQPLPFLVQKGCTALQATSETNAEYAKKRLAPGLSPRMGSKGPIFSVRAWQCTTSQYANKTLALGTVAMLSLEVEAAPHLQGLSEIEAWWVPVVVFTATPDAARYFEEYGFPVRQATNTLHIKETPGGGKTVAFLLEIQDGATRLRLFGGLTMDKPSNLAFTRHFTLNATHVRGGLDELRSPASAGTSETGVLAFDGSDAPIERPTTVRAVGHFWPSTVNSFTWLPFEPFPEEADPTAEL